MVQHRPQATLRPGTTVAGFAAHPARGLERASSSATSRTGTRGRNRGRRRKFRLRRLLHYYDAVCARTVMGKLRLLCQQPKTRSNRLIESAWIEATIDAAIRNSRPSAQARVRFWTGLIFRISNRSRYARPRPQYQPPPPSKNTISTTTKIVSTLILKSSEKQSGRSAIRPSVQ